MSASDKLTVEDFRNVEAAYKRGEKHTMERLGDGVTRLRKKPLSAEHDRIHADLSAWLNADTYGLRAPGVKDNLFRLSDYVSGRLPVPPREVLTFLHAYIFALEGAHYYAKEEIKRARKHRNPLPPLPRKPKPVAEPTPPAKEK